MRRLAFTLLTLCITISHANAGTGKAEIYGGSDSCGKWLAVRDDPVQHYFQLNWVLGWTSAAGHYITQVDLKETDSDAISAWVDNYCKGHPIDYISDAAAALVRALAKNSKP